MDSISGFIRGLPEICNSRDVVPGTDPLAQAGPPVSVDTRIFSYIVSNDSELGKCRLQRLVDVERLSPSCTTYLSHLVEDSRHSYPSRSN